jgi:glucokinase
MVEGSQRKYPSQTSASLEAILDQYLAETKARPTAAGFGVAGPVKNGVAKITNLPWVIDAGALAKKLAVARVGLGNDLVANAAGIEVLPPGSFVELYAGAPNAGGNRAVIAAGTGLGHASIFFDGKRYTPVPAEVGHGDFAPRNETEVELWRYLTGKFGRASYERILSGPGLWNVYEFFRDVKKIPEPPAITAELAPLAKPGDRTPVISTAALAGTAEGAVKALALFVEVYGAQAGNFALSTYATGGVYIGGGIAPRIIPALKTGAFVHAFLDKKPMDKFMAEVPVRVILNSDTALYGAAVLARDA